MANRKRLYRCPRTECGAVLSGAANLRYHVNAHRRTGEVVPVVARRSDLVVEVTQLDLFNGC